MKKILILFFAISFCVSCGGPNLYKKPQDFVGGNTAAAVDTHCARKAGEGKDSAMYKLCEQSYNTHYGK